MSARGRSTKIKKGTAARDKSVHADTGVEFKTKGEVIAAINTNEVVNPRTERVKDSDIVLIGKGMQDLILANQNFIFGVDTISVVAEALKGIALARVDQDPAQLVPVCVIAVILGQTTANGVAAAYPAIGNQHFMVKFDITGRKASEGGKDQWVLTGNMNASAMRILGHLIIHAGAIAGSRVAEELIQKRGTIFSPSDDETEFAELCREYKASEDEKDAAAMFYKEYEAIALAVCNALGSGSGSLDVLYSIAAASATSYVQF